MQKLAAYNRVRTSLSAAPLPAPRPAASGSVAGGRRVTDDSAVFAEAPPQRSGAVDVAPLLTAPSGAPSRPISRPLYTPKSLPGLAPPRSGSSDFSSDPPAIARRDDALDPQPAPPESPAVDWEAGRHFLLLFTAIVVDGPAASQSETIRSAVCVRASAFSGQSSCVIPALPLQNAGRLIGRSCPPPAGKGVPLPGRPSPTSTSGRPGRQPPAMCPLPKVKRKTPQSDVSARRSLGGVVRRILRTRDLECSVIFPATAPALLFRHRDPLAHGGGIRHHLACSLVFARGLDNAGQPWGRCKRHGVSTARPGEKDLGRSRCCGRSTRWHIPHYYKWSSGGWQGRPTINAQAPLSCVPGASESSCLVY